MPTYRYPVLICRDPAGGFSAIAVDEGTVGFGATVADARNDLRDYLRWLHRKVPYTPKPDFHDPELRWFRVAVRPEYRTKTRLYPCENDTTLAVPCVVGTRGSGQPTADLPLVGIRFDYPNRSELGDLVRRYALQKLEGITPAELARFLHPADVELIEIAVAVPRGDANSQFMLPSPRTLSRVAEPVGDRAVRKGYARAWGREAELAALAKKLHREKANVLLVGEPGVGKTTLMVDAVKEAEKRFQEVDKANGETQHQRRFWLTSAGRLVAGMKYLGQWEERVEGVISELGEISGVLCVERLLGLVQRGGIGPTDSIAAFLMPYLARGEVRLLAEATPAELDACRRLLPGFAELFQIVLVQPFERAAALAVIDKQLGTSASGPGIEIARGSGERIVRLFRRFMPYASFPGPASSFARELVEAHARLNKKSVTANDVVERFRRRTGLPELFLRDEITLERDAVREWFRVRVIDQPEACEAATNVVLTVKAGLNDPARPPAVLLFCGPTGVGKTHMAQALATYFFGASDAEVRANERLIRFDMSEFGGFDAVYRLLGPPQGEPGELVKRVRRQPFSVLLLDEIEKASAAVFDTLMGVFDEGRLTDQYGRVTNFRSTIIVMTSNIGTGTARSVGFNEDTGGARYKEAAMKFFRPEFFNRMDTVVTFDPLKLDTIRAIAKRELVAISLREGLLRANMSIHWSDALIAHLAAIGFDARYGARPMQRVIEREVVAPLAKWLIENGECERKAITADWHDARCSFHAE